MYSLIILGIVALVILLSAGHAALFGLPKARARLVVTILSAAAALGSCYAIKLFLPTPEATINLIQNNYSLIGEQFGTDIVKILQQAIEYANISPTLVELVVQLAAAILLPLVCLILFVVYALVAWCIYAIISFFVRRAAKKKAEREGEEYEYKKGPRWVAACLGLVQGVVIAALVLMPLSAYLAIAEPTLNELTAQGVLDAEEPVIAQTQEIVSEVNTSTVMSVYRLAGGELITDSIMNMKVAGMNVKTTDELSALITLAQHVLELTKVEFADYSEEQAAIIRSIGDSFGDSQLLSPIVGDILYAATDAWLNGEAFLGIERPSLGESAEMFEPFVMALLEIFHEDAKDAILLQADIRTLAEMVATMAQNRIFATLSDTTELLKTLNTSGVISELVTALGSNSSMKRLVPEVMNLGVRAIGQALNMPVDTQAVYDKFMAEVTDTLNEVRDLPKQEQISTLSAELGDAFDKAGMDVDAQVLDFYSTAMLHDLVDQNAADTVTVADVQAFFVLYADNASQATASLSTKPRFDLLNDQKSEDPLAGSVYAEMTEEQRSKTAAATVANLCVQLTTLSEDDADLTEKAKTLVTEAFTELLGDSSEALEVVISVEITAPIPQSTVEHASSMKSTEEMKKTSTIITLETLLLDSKTVAETITPENISVDAEAISAIFNAATDLMDVLNGDTSNLDLASLANSVGTILDSLNKTETFGKDKTAALFTAVLQSETVRDAADIDMKTATQLAGKATEGDADYSKTMSTIAGTVSVIDKLSADDTIPEEDLVDLIRNLTPQTAGMIEVYVTPVRLVKYGIPEKHAPITSDLIKSLFSYMANEQLKDFDAEAKALNQILTLGLAAKESDDKNLFSSAPGADDGKLPTAQETVNTLLDSDAVKHALVDVLTDGKQVTVFDPYEFSEKLSEESQDYKDAVAAVHAYRDAHPEVDDLVFEALAALLGIQIDLSK